MGIGLSTYSFFWRHSERVSNPLDLPAMLVETAKTGVDTFQICDFPAIETLSEAELLELRALADRLGLRLELGVRGVRADALARYLRLAIPLGVTLVRSMIYTSDDHPSIDAARSELLVAMPGFEAAGVTLALETYEQVSTSELVDLIESVASPNLGICLDVANVIARLEDQVSVIDRVAPFVKNLHSKDFQFVRADGLVGFALVGAELGEGLLDLDHLFDTVRPFERGVSVIVEHWLPWQGSERSTVALEDDWTSRSVRVLKSIQEAYKSTG